MVPGVGGVLGDASCRRRGIMPFMDPAAHSRASMPDRCVGWLAAVVALLVTAWLLAQYGLSAWDQTRLTAALIVTGVLPGWWAARLVAPCAPRPVRASIAWTAGLAVSLLGWFAAVHLGHVWAWIVPLVVAMTTRVLPLVNRQALTRGGGRRVVGGVLDDEGAAVEDAGRDSCMPWWGSVALLVSWLLVLRALVSGVWSVTPLDGRGPWYQDMYWHLSLTVDALHHAPLSDPQSAAEPALSYHWFSNASAAAQVMTSGVDVRHVTIVWWYVPTMLAALGLVYGLATRVAGHAAGALAVVLVPLAPAVATLDSVMASVSSALVWFSPSHVLAVPVGLLAIWVCLQLLDDRPVGRALVALAVVVGIECAGSKVSLLPTVFGGVAVVVIARWRARSGLRRALLVLVGLVVVLAVTAPVFAGGGGGSRLSYGAYAGQMPVWAHDPSGGWRDAATMTLLIVVMMIPFTFVLPVMYLLVAHRDSGYSTHRHDVHRATAGLFFLGCLVAALGAFFALEHPSGSQAYFVRGMAAPVAVFASAGVICAVRSLVESWAGAPGGAHAVRLRMLMTVALAAVAGLVIGLVWVSSDFFSAVHVPKVVWLAPLAFVALVIVVLIGRAARRRRPWVALLCVGIVGFACAPGVHALAKDPRPALHVARPQRALPTLSDAEVAATAWIAQHNSSDALVATNVHCRDIVTTPHCIADSFWVSAFSESPVLVGGWGYSSSAREHHGSGGYSYLRQPYRPADVGVLNEAVFSAPTPQILEQLRARGVRYLYADARAGRVSSQLDRLSPPVFSRDGVTVHDLGGEQIGSR